MTDARQAALMLHALSPADRVWMLERLGAHERAVVEPLLEELATLGIPADERLVQDALRRVSASAAVPDGTERRLAAMSVAEIAPLLRDEPAAFVACVLQLAAWPWAAAYVEGLDASMRRRLGDANHDALPMVSPALRAWLLEALVERADERSAS